MAVKEAGTWMPLYVADYLADTSHLQVEEHGAYLLMLMHYWRNGPLKFDERFLRNLSKLSAEQWSDSRETLLAFFEVRDGFLHHGRVDAEIERAQSMIKAKKKAANKRWHGERSGGGEGDNVGNADAYADAAEEVLHEHAAALRVQSPSPSPSPSPTPNGVKVPPYAPPTKAEASPQAAQPTKPDPRGYRLPLDWEPTEQDRDFATANGLDPDRVTAEFRDYWASLPGKSARKLDWSATFRNRVRQQSIPRRPTGAASARPSTNGATELRRQAESRGMFLAELPP